MLRSLLLGFIALVNIGCMPMLIHEAKTPEIRGLVLDGIDGKPVVGVQVELIGHRPTSDPDPVRLTDITDQQGHFVLEEQSRRRAELAMPGSYLLRFPLTAHDPKADHSAYTVINMISRTRAGESNRYAVLLLLPDNPEPLPSACPVRSETAYALHAAERLSKWQEQAWFRQKILTDTYTIRQFADGLYSMLNHVPGSPACFQQPEVVERLDQARQNVRDFIDHQPHYRYARSKVTAPAPGFVWPGDDTIPDVYGNEVVFAGMRGTLAYVLNAERVVSHVIFDPIESIEDSQAPVAEDLSVVADLLSTLLGFSPRELSGEQLLWDDPAQKHVYEAMLLDTAGGGLATRVILRSRDPTRLCGSSDGFAPWFAKLQRAILEDRRQDVAKAFRYPFFDQAGTILGVSPDHLLHFDHAEDFISRYQQPEVQEMLSSLTNTQAPTCAPYGHEGVIAGYAIPVEYGTIQAYPHDTSWQLRLVYYLP